MTVKEKKKKPMLDLDALEVGFYAKGRDGNFYKVDLPVSFPVTKSIDVLTGEIHYQNNYGRLKSLSMEELAFELAQSGCPKVYFIKDNEFVDCPAEREPSRADCVKCWLEWLKEEIADA